MTEKKELEKKFEYYTREKHRYIPYINNGKNKILELGCAAGRLGKRLRELGKVGEMIGIEIFEPAAQEAKKYYNHVYVGDIETLDLYWKKYFDYILCGDVLEHLKNPWDTVNKIHTWLKDDGILIATVPNVRYWRLLRDIIFKGKWEYAEHGILDSTHLRFFTRKTFLQLVQDSGFSIEHDQIIIQGPKQRFFNYITLKIFNEFLGNQVMVLAKKKYIN